MLPHQLQSQSKACLIAGQTFARIKKFIRPGKTEKEISYKINKIMRSLGASKKAFQTIVAAADHSSIPHHKTTDRKIQKNDIILLDFGCKINGFCSDLSRTIFIGQPRPEWLKVYNIVKTAQKKAFKKLNNSIRASDLDLVCRDYISKMGFGKNFIHGLGHGIGTRVHQYFKISPKSNIILKPGMIFTIEPGIYIENKFGVRIEDTVYWSKSGLRILTMI